MRGHDLKVRSEARSVRFSAVLCVAAVVCLVATSVRAVDWESHTPPADAGNMLNGVWGSGPNDVYAVGYNLSVFSNGSSSGKILHYDGASWSLVHDVPHVFLSAVWGSGPNDVFAVGMMMVIDPNWISPLFTSEDGVLADSESSDSNTTSGGVILHYDGTSWTRMESGMTPRLNGIWGTGPNDVYAVGGSGSVPYEGMPSTAHGVVLHYDGSSWSEMWSGTTAYCEDVWASGPNDIFVVGGASYNESSVLHYDGSGWSIVWTGQGSGMKGVWGIGPNNVFAVGSILGLYYDSGLILHYDGSQWSSITPDGSSGLNGIWGDGPNDVFAVGQDGAILHYDGVPSAWEGLPRWRWMSSGTSDPLYAVWGSGPMDVFAAGSHLPRPPRESGTVRILHYGRFFTLCIETIHPEWGQVTSNSIPSLVNPPRYGPGTRVMLTATPIQGYGFGGWEVYDPDYPGDANHTVLDANNPATIVMNADRQVRATFGPFCKLKVFERVEQWGAVVVEPNLASYPPNARVRLTALPWNEQLATLWPVTYDPDHPGDANYASIGAPSPIVSRFRYWELFDPCHPNDPNYMTIDANNPTTIIMNADRQVTAVFLCGSGIMQAMPLLMIGIGTVCLWSMSRRSSRGRRIRGSPSRSS